MNHFPTLEKAPPSQISAGELYELRERERLIQSGLNRFMEIGAHLLVIREQKLYRAEYCSFEQYCQERWEMSDRYARRMCAAAQVTQLLAASDVLPATESQARPLTTLPAESVVEIWGEVVRTAPGGRVTARHVEKVIADRLNKNLVPLPSATETATTPAPERKAFAPTVLASHDDQLHLQLESAISEVRSLLDEIGTADSAAGADVLGALHKLENFKVHLRRMDDLKARRA